MTEPTARALDAWREFVSTITVLYGNDGGVSIQVPIMDQHDRTVTYLVGPEGDVTQIISDNTFAEAVCSVRAVIPPTEGGTDD